MKRIRGFVLFCIGISLLSCLEDRAVSEQLRQAEQLMEQAADSSLAILKQIASPEHLSARQNALWCLLFTQAQDKKGGQHTSDSLIQVAVTYFEKNNKPAYLMKAYYYTAVIYHDASDSPRAQAYYLKALEAAETLNDHALMGRIYGNLGSIYTNQGLSDKVLEFQRKAKDCFIATNDTTSIGMALRNMGRIYTNSNQLDSAIVYYEKALPFLAERNRSSIYNEIGGIYKRLEQYPKALKYINLAFASLTSTSETLTLYYNVGDLYRRTEQYDSAFYYLSQCLNASNSRTKAGANLSLSLLEENHQNWQESLRYRKQAQFLRDSINQAEQSRELQRIQSLYNYQQAEQERFVFERKANRRTFQLYGLLAIGAIFIITFVAYHQWRKRIDRESHEKELRLLEQKQYEKTQIHLAKQGKMTEEFKQTPLYADFSAGTQKVSNEDWGQLKIAIEAIYPDFTAHLKEALSDMETTEIRLCYLAKMNISSKRMATLLHLSESGVSKKKQRLYKKMNGEKGTAKDFDIFMIGFQ